MNFTGVNRPEGYPDLLKITVLGCQFLIDYKELSIVPLSAPPVGPEALLNYLIAEGFLIPEPENHSDGQAEDWSRN